jgi:hypothetical protein
MRYDYTIKTKAKAIVKVGEYNMVETIPDPTVLFGIFLSQTELMG